jgi:hypothetical protein
MSEQGNDDPRLSTAYMEVFDGVLEVTAPSYGKAEFDAACEELRFDLRLLDDADLWRAFEQVYAMGYCGADDPDYSKTKLAEAITLGAVLERFAGERLADAMGEAEEREDRERDALIERGELRPEFADHFPEEWAD